VTSKERELLEKNLKSPKELAGFLGDFVKFCSFFYISFVLPGKIAPIIRFCAISDDLSCRFCRKKEASGVIIKGYGFHTKGLSQ